MEKGAEVYKNCCSNGDIDLVLRIDDELIPVDVKAKKWNYRWGRWAASNGDRIGEGVYPLGVDPETMKVSWYRKDKQNGKNAEWQCPPGLETFWDD